MTVALPKERQTDRFTPAVWLGDASGEGTEQNTNLRSSCINGNSCREAKRSPLCLLLETATNRSLWNRGCVRPLNRPLAQLALPEYRLIFSSSASQHQDKENSL